MDEQAIKSVRYCAVFYHPYHLSVNLPQLFHNLKKISNLNNQAMQISKNTVVAIHYTLKDNEGNVLDSSKGKDPLYYLHGANNLIAGMEEGLEGKKKGDKFQIKVSPEKGYGAHNPNLVAEVPHSAFDGQDVKTGMKFRTNQGSTITVTNVGIENVTVDGNHPLAGVELNFDVEVMDVRNATSEELSHGHAHDPDGHH